MHDLIIMEVAYTIYKRIAKIVFKTKQVPNRLNWKIKLEFGAKTSGINETYNVLEATC